MSERVEEFYNACHSPKDGRFCGRSASGSWPKGATIVLQSGLRGKAAGRYKYATGAGQTGHPGRGGNKKAGATPSAGGSTGGLAKGGSKAAKVADTLKKGAKSTTKDAFQDQMKKAKGATKPKINKDDGLPTPTFKLTGNKRKDTLQIMRLDRDSPERAAAIKKWNKAYAGK